MDPALLNGANLAFIGDAYFELYIRRYLLSQGITNQNQLHKECVKYVSARGHSVIVDEIKVLLTEEELNVFKRGRNARSLSRRSNVNLQEYLQSSGFEAVIGYLYLKENFPRLREIIDLAIKIIEGLDNESNNIR